MKCASAPNLAILTSRFPSPRAMRQAKTCRRITRLALRWFLKAAEQGHVGAQDTLGAYYYLGRGAPKDVTKAYFWSLLGARRRQVGE